MSECPGRLSQIPVGEEEVSWAEYLQFTDQVRMTDEWFFSSSLRGQRRSKKSHPQAAVNFRPEPFPGGRNRE